VPQSAYFNFETIMNGHEIISIMCFDGKPYRNLMLALGVSLFLHLLILLNADNLFWHKHRGKLRAPDFQAKITKAYRPDPLAIHETVETNDPEASLSARFKSPPVENNMPIPLMLSVPATLPVERLKEKSLGNLGDKGGGDDCRISGFQFCSSL
jgi:hypothetical protein